MRNTIKINFVDFWTDFHKKDNYFYHLLRQKFDVILEENDPDVVIGSYDYNNKKEILRYKDHRCLKVYYTGESDPPRGFPYDIEFTQRRIDNQNHMRLPLWAFFCSWFGENTHVICRDPSYLTPYEGLDKNKIDLEKVFDSKKGFCNFIYADATPERNKWFDAISKISKVDSAGILKNNLNYRIQGRGDQIFKQIFMADHLFSLAIENCSVDGYATEKLLHPMAVLSIPIYWGDSNIHKDVNVDSIVDLRNRNEKDVLDEISFLLSSKNRYLDKLSKSWFLTDHREVYKKQTLNFIVDAMLSKGIKL